MGLTARVERRISEDFPGREGQAVGLLAELVDHLTVMGVGQDMERITAAVLLCGRGRSDLLCRAVQTAKDDWRDALVGGGLGDADWAERLSAEFGADA